VFLGSKVAFYAMLIFLAVISFALVYGWRKGVLQWLK
jgi:NADH:ubiquinone oxidoreductase subunit 3 (subunit A)